MSAFLVKAKHIAILSTWMENQYPNDNRFQRERTAPILAEENIKSLGYRYPNTKEKENLDFLRINQDYIDLCTTMKVGKPVMTISATLVEKHIIENTPIEIIKLADCLSYQSCEHPDYYTSEAHRITENIKAKAITKLEGYENAPWGL